MPLLLRNPRASRGIGGLVTALGCRPTLMKRGRRRSPFAEPGPGPSAAGARGHPRRHPCRRRAPRAGCHRPQRHPGAGPRRLRRRHLHMEPAHGGVVLLSGDCSDNTASASLVYQGLCRTVSKSALGPHPVAGGWPPSVERMPVDLSTVEGPVSPFRVTFVFFGPKLLLSPNVDHLAAIAFR